jgi:hypothetical protein
LTPGRRLTLREIRRPGSSQPGLLPPAWESQTRYPPDCAPRGLQALLNWRVQNDPFWSTSVGAAEVAALQAAREQALICTATAARGRFGTHSAHAESDGGYVWLRCHRWV